MARKRAKRLTSKKKKKVTSKTNNTQDPKIGEQGVDNIENALTSESLKDKNSSTFIDKGKVVVMDFQVEEPEENNGEIFNLEFEDEPTKETFQFIKKENEEHLPSPLNQYGDTKHSTDSESTVIECVPSYEKTSTLNDTSVISCQEERNILTSIPANLKNFTDTATESTMKSSIYNTNNASSVKQEPTEFIERFSDDNLQNSFSTNKTQNVDKSQVILPSDLQSMSTEKDKLEDSANSSNVPVTQISEENKILKVLSETNNKFPFNEALNNSNICSKSDALEDNYSNNIDIKNVTEYNTPAQINEIAYACDDDDDEIECIQIINKSGKNENHAISEKNGEGTAFNHEDKIQCNNTSVSPVNEQSLISHETEFLENSIRNENFPSCVNLLSPVWASQRHDSPNSFYYEELALHKCLTSSQNSRGWSAEHFCKNAIEQEYLTLQRSRNHDTNSQNVPNQERASSSSCKIKVKDEPNVDMKPILVPQMKSSEFPIPCKNVSNQNPESNSILPILNKDDNEQLNEDDLCDIDSVGGAHFDVSKVQKIDKISTNNPENASETHSCEKNSNVPERGNMFEDLFLTVENLQSIIQTAQAQKSDKNVAHTNDVNSLHNLHEDSSDDDTRDAGCDPDINSMNEEKEDSSSEINSIPKISSKKNCPNEQSVVPRKKSKYERIMERKEKEKAELLSKISVNKLSVSEDPLSKVDVTNENINIFHPSSRDKISSGKNKKVCNDKPLKRKSPHQESSHNKKPKDVSKSTTSNKDESSSNELVFQELRDSNKKMRFRNRNSPLFEDMTKNSLSQNCRPKTTSLRQKNSQTSRCQPSMEEVHAQIPTDDITVPLPKISYQEYFHRQTSVQFSPNKATSSHSNTHITSSIQQQNINYQPQDPRLRKYGGSNALSNPRNHPAELARLKYPSETPDIYKNKALLPTPQSTLTSRSQEMEIQSSGALSRRNYYQASPTFSNNALLPPPASPNSTDNHFHNSIPHRSFVMPNHTPYPIPLPQQLRDPRKFSRKNSGDSYEVSLLPRELMNCIGKKVITENDALMLILSWVPEWLKEVELVSHPPPVCGPGNTPLTEISISFVNMQEHFNTFFPIMLHDLFYRIYELHKEEHRKHTPVLDLDIVKTNFGDMMELQVQMPYTKGMLFPSEGQLGIATFTLKDGQCQETFVYVSNQKVYKETDRRNVEILHYYLKTSNGLTNVDKTIKMGLFGFYPLSKVLIQIKALSLLDDFPLRDIILQPCEPFCSKIILDVIGFVYTSLNVISDAVKKIKDSLVIDYPDERRILIVDSPPGTDLVSTLIALIGDIKKSKLNSRILFCVRNTKHLEDIGLRLLSASTSEQSSLTLNTVILSKPKNIQNTALRKLTLDEKINQYIIKTKNESSLSKTSPLSVEKHRANAQKEVIENSDIILSLILQCYDSNIATILKQNDTTKFTFCIISEAYSCTETESLLPLLYGINKLVLAGDPSAKPKVICAHIEKFKYYRSLADRLSKGIKQNFA